MRKLANEELHRLDIASFKTAPKTPLIVVLDNVRSLNNIGSIFRTCDAFRIEKIYLCGITARPPHKDIHKTALGATESVDWVYFENTLEAVQHLQRENVFVFAIEQALGASMLHQVVPQRNKRYALVFGNEVNGVAQEVVSHCDGIIEIPQLGTKHSLNVSVSAGIVVWDFFSKINQ